VTIPDRDISYMRSAMNMARRGQGRCAPCPSVGCVIVKDDIVVGRGRTAEGGRPHAEAAALAQAGALARGATVYVTLEPCAVQGRGGPCADALIKAGVKRVVIACLDLNLAVNGKGIELLKAAGVDVDLGVLEDEARYMHKGFFLKHREGRPLVRLKTACTLDGKVALSNGQSKWITGEYARKHVHMIRGQHDAVMVGIGTALADDPMLTARLDGVKHNTIRVVLDSRMQISPDSKLVKSAKEYPLWVFYEEQSDSFKVLENAGVILIENKNRDLESVLRVLTENNVTRLLVEGGAMLHSSFLKSGLWDEMMIYRSSSFFGGDAKNITADLNLTDVVNSFDMNRIHSQCLGQDTLEVYQRKTG